MLDDLITLTLNQSNGRIIEFPLTGVTKVYRIVRKDEHWSLRCALGGHHKIRLRATRTFAIHVA